MTDERPPGMLTSVKALGKGMATTAKVLGRRAHTAQYPHVEPDLPERSHGVIALLESNCTSCMLCARECPDWCIYIDSHKETTEPGPEGGRARSHNVLDRFDIDFSLCMYCGICIEVCPFDALFWAPDFAYAEGDIRNLLHGKDRLEGWMERVPEPALPDGGRGGRAAAAAAKAAAEAEAPAEEEAAVRAAEQVDAEGSAAADQVAKDQVAKDRGAKGQEETERGAE